MEHIENGEEIKAQFIFNKDILHKYSKEMVPDSDIYIGLELWETLKTYLNTIDTRAINDPSVRREYLLSVYDDYKHDYKRYKILISLLESLKFKQQKQPERATQKLKSINTKGIDDSEIVASYAFVESAINGQMTIEDAYEQVAQSIYKIRSNG